MSIITFSSPKGGAGKTTAAVVTATELAEQGASVTIIDADPEAHVMDWSLLPGRPDTLKVVAANEDSIIDEIESAAAESSFVIVDLEGTANMILSLALSMSDFVVIPVQGSQLDAKQAAKQIKLIKSYERASKRVIPFSILLTKTNPTIQPKTLKHIIERFESLAIPVLKTRLHDREAYRALFSFGGTLSGLADKGVSNLTVAKSNALELTSEIIEHLRAARQEQQKEVA